MDTISNTFFDMQQKIRRLNIRPPFKNYLLEDTLKGLLGCWVNIVDDVSSKSDNIFKRFDGQMSSLINMIKDVRIMGNVYSINDDEECNDFTTADYDIWYDSTNTFFSTLQKIRAMPESNLRNLMEKAFEAYICFLAQFK